MSGTREFSIYRYNSTNKPRVLGKIPFFAEGPNSRRLMPSLRWAFRSHFGEGTDDDKEVVAEYLLEDGLVVALWATSMRTCVAKELRRAIEISELVKELGPIPWRSHTGIYWDIGDAVWEYLDGLATVEMRRRYVVEDGIILE